MNRVTETLREEHRLIGRAAACLDRLADETLETGEVPTEMALAILEFFESFANTAHQQKEERYLFPALLPLGLAQQLSLEFLADHDKEHSVLRTMRHDLELAAYGSAEFRDRFAPLAREYARLQREHADHEDAVLLPLVEEFMNDSTEAQVLGRFHELDARLLEHPAAYYNDLVERAEAKLVSIA